MKQTIGACIVGVAFIVGSAAFAAKDSKSRISQFEGKYKGNVTLSQFPEVVFGTCQGKFTTSSNKEKGKLALKSIFSTGGSLAPVDATYRFNKRRVNYTLAVSGMAVSANGSARIKKNGRISYNVLIGLGGSETANIVGNIRRTKSRLKVSESLIQSFGTGTFAYNLRVKGRSK